MRLETEQAASELKECEQRSESRLKILRASADKAESVLQASEADLQEVQHLASAADTRDEQELKDLLTLKEEQVRQHHNLQSSIRNICDKADSYKESKQIFESEISAEKAEMERLQSIVE